jgi:hypothetical protein
MTYEFVPVQTEGAATDVVERKTCSDREDAAAIFKTTKQRLLNVDAWKDICKGLSASFTVTGSDGIPTRNLPVVGDYIRIDIPGPASAVGKGYDWVQVELMETTGTASDTNESIIMRVRPASNPQQEDGPVAHFMDETATSSFIVRRNDCIVEVAILGRNEKPNTNSDNITDNIRNAVTGIAAAAGFSAVQWKKLASALLDS